MSKENQVKDYLFLNGQDVLLAKKELEKIEKLEAKMGDADIELLYKVYNKSIENRTFQTPVGMEFMKKLKGILETNPGTPGEVMPIPVFAAFDTEARTDKEAEDKKKTSVKAIKNASALKWSLFINGVMVVLIILMFYILTTGDNPNVLNYEHAIINKYSAWEQELDLREAKVREAEKTLNITE